MMRDRNQNKLNETDRVFVETIRKVSGTLKEGERFIGKELLTGFQSDVENIAEKIADIKEVNRTLKIGIVGEVKAGKSSFLNALFFKGESILPKAPTPMTAALTKISYAEKPSAKIVFYQKNDWDRILRLSREYEESVTFYLDKEIERYNNRSQDTSGKYVMPTREGVEKRYRVKIPMEQISANELVEMVEERNLMVEEHLGQVEELQVDTSTEDFMKELQSYVGAKGKMTPLVNYTELRINNPLLKDVEVIDTPGLNDPILSRSETTKKFLISCDVVFLLSYVGQFLGEEDIRFLTKNLSEESVGRAVIIGSKFDSGVLDYTVPHASIRQAMKGSMDNFNMVARNNIEKLMRSPHAPVVRKIYEELPPYYISGLLYSAARKVEENRPLNEEEEHILNRLKISFPGFQETSSFLYDFANIDHVKEKVFVPVTEEKEKILTERMELFTKEQTIRLMNSMEEISIFSRNNLKDLKNSDVDALQEKLEKLTGKLNSIRSEVRNIFQNASIDARKVLKDIAVDVELEVENYRGLDVKKRTEEKTEVNKVGFMKKQVDKVKIHIDTVDVSEVISNLRKYTTKVKKYINGEYERLFDIRNLKRDVKEAVIGAFDLSARDFNENDILIPVEMVLKKLTIPEIEIELEKYDQLILSQFTDAVVESQMISELQLAQEMVLQKIMKDISSSIEKTAKDVELILMEQSGTFVDNIEMKLKSNVENLKMLLQDKEENIRAFEKYIEEIGKAKEELSKIRA